MNMFKPVIPRIELKVSGAEEVLATLDELNEALKRANSLIDELALRMKSMKFEATSPEKNCEE